MPAAVLLGERVHLATVAGGVLLLAGVAMVERAPAPARMRPPEPVAE
ncbi:MAG TPA: hypothetical protein VMR21_06465 [Vicinamibacteria bacterium]|nr:hypothetical protein [Vicinamibacteria bacterium]